MNVAGVLTKKERFEGTQNGAEAGREETLTEADDCFVGFDVDKSPIEIPFHDCGLEANDFQRLALVFTRLARVFTWCPRERLPPFAQ
jgi:hypothetical protein